MITDSPTTVALEAAIAKPHTTAIIRNRDERDDFGVSFRWWTDLRRWSTADLDPETPRRTWFLSTDSRLAVVTLNDGVVEGDTFHLDNTALAHDLSAGIRGEWVIDAADIDSLRTILRPKGDLEILWVQP